MNAKLFSIATAVTALFVLAVALHLGCTSGKHPNDSRLPRTTALERNSPTMTLSQLDSVFSQDFKIVKSVDDIPDVVKTSFCNLERCNFKGVKFDMVDPGETMSTDYIIPGVPNKKLVIAALSENAAVLLYVRGGYADRLCVTVFDFRARASWGAYLKNYHTRDFDELRKAIADRDFVQWLPDVTG